MLMPEFNKNQKLTSGTFIIYCEGMIIFWLFYCRVLLKISYPLSCDKVLLSKHLLSVNCVPTTWLFSILKQNEKPLPCLEISQAPVI